MSPIERIEHLFHEALLRPAGPHRDAWLEHACQGDAVLQADVVSLIGHHQQLAVNAMAMEPPPVPPVPVDSFGPYRAVRLLGRGGMGAVYLAERNDGRFEQQVAVKVMAAHLVGEDFLQRFLREGQLLAALNHQNITRLIDGGVTSGGQPYLVLEYVDGAPLDLFCNWVQMDVRARLRLFLQVCQAVDFAHRNLILHRDLKPSNVLVTPAGRVKLLDFGTSSLMSAHDQALTRVRMLTPRYASPGQLRNERATIQDDVFSLGVILFELLTGAWPYGDPDSAVAGLERVSNDAMPASPSTAATEEAAAARSIPLDRLRRLLKGDLSVITLKALDSNVERRYATTAELMADVEAYLEGRPVSGRQGEFVYRTMKLVRRNKLAIAASVVLAASIVGGIGGVLWQARIAQEQGRKAEARAEDLRKLSNALLSDLDAAIRKLPGSTEAQKMLVTTVTEHLGRMAKDSSDDPGIQNDMANSWVKLGNVQGNPYDQNIGDVPGALSSLDKAIAIAEPQVRKRPGDAEAKRTLARAHQSRGEVLFGAGKAPEAALEMRGAVNLYDGLAADKRAPVAALHDAQSAYGALADILGQPGTSSLSDQDGALAAYRKSLEFVQRILVIEPANVRALRGAVVARYKIANIVSQTDPPKALEIYRAALAAVEALPVGVRETFDIQRLNSFLLRLYGGALAEVGHYEEAITAMEQSKKISRRFLVADTKDARALDDMVVILDNESGVYEDRQAGTFGPGVNSLEDARISLGLLSEALEIQEQLVRLKQANGRQSMLGWELVRAGWQKRLLHVAGEGFEESRRGVALLREVALSEGAQTIAFDQAAAGLLFVEPDHLREPGLALQASERAVELSKRRRPGYLLTLAVAYRAVGKVELARQTAREGLELLVKSETPFRVRLLLEAEMGR